MVSEKKRERKVQEQRSYAGRREETAARALDKQIKKAFRRRWAARLVIALGGVIAVQHWLAHLGDWDTGWQDLVVGYPMAGIVALVGFIMLGSSPSPR